MQEPTEDEEDYGSEEGSDAGGVATQNYSAYKSV
jgi:hypothetical protein